MRDALKRIGVITAFGTFSGYLIYSLIMQKPIVLPEYQHMNFVFCVVLIVISLYISIFYGIYPIHVRFSRATLFVLGISAIVMGKTVFLNDPMNDAYFGDLSCVVGVLLLIIGPTNFIMTSGVKKKREEKNLEIIEV
ncbi:hypothetical protein BSK20_04690 [SR1 bacterium human oral taxon HOT-345]|nr:hypothetical protein BSK20_04690 [SR1 bacterium human oral taxon HOT-345]